jgi:hypothetical protein
VMVSAFHAKRETREKSSRADELVPSVRESRRHMTIEVRPGRGDEPPHAYNSVAAKVAAT